MTPPRSALAAYQAAIATTPPLQAVVLLYDGVLTRIHAAGAAAASGNYEVQFNEITRANDILRGLRSALDVNTGGPVALRLRDAYDANMRALQRAVGRKDAGECLRRIADGLRELRNAWAEIAGMAALADLRQH